MPITAGSVQHIVQAFDSHRGGTVLKCDCPGPKHDDKAFEAVIRTAPSLTAEQTAHEEEAHDTGHMGQQSETQHIERTEEDQDETEVQNGTAEAGESELNEGVIPNSLEDLSKDLLEENADNGDVLAMLMLSLAYDQGDFGVRDTALSLAWLHRAAEFGHQGAQYALGQRYHLGDGVKVNLAAAEYFYREAAREGHAESQFDLGLLLLHKTAGTDHDENESEHLCWWRLAAEQQHPQALQALELELAQALVTQAA